VPLATAFAFFIGIVVLVLLGSNLLGPDSWPIQSDRKAAMLKERPTDCGIGCGVPCPGQGRPPGKRNAHLVSAFFLPCNLEQQSTGPTLRFLQCTPRTYRTP